MWRAFRVQGGHISPALFDPMAKQVRERSNAHAWVVLNKKGEEIATIHSIYGSTGTVQVDVFTEGRLSHQAKAHGGGYDKETAALQGAVIDGHKMHDHCGTDEKTKKLEAAMKVATTKEAIKAIEGKAARIGAQFANWDRTTGRYSSCHYEHGLKRLTLLGYTVIQAI